MSCAVQPSSRRPAGLGLVLLVLAVLAGVLAMHGLAPARTTTAVGSGHGVVMAHEQAVEAAGDCVHATGGSGHAQHADAMCAAAGVGTPYAPPPLVSAPGVPPATRVVPPGAAGAPKGGRAPPDLAELQLLRI